MIHKKQLIRRKRCRRKVRYETFESAFVEFKRIGNAQMKVYRCAICKGWHLGRANSGVRKLARLEQLIGNVGDV